MANRHNHYEAAFEDFLRQEKIPYVAVDESRRSLHQDSSLKSLDFIVSPPQLPHSWLIDVKGRRFPSGNQKKQYWKNWSTVDELRSLAHWEEVFGQRFISLLVFAYNVVGEMAPMAPEYLFEHRGGLYGFVGVRLDHYTSWSHQLSPKWDTVTMSAAQFRSLSQPVQLLFNPSQLTENIS